MTSKLRIALDKVNVWKVRVVALSILVLLVGGSSQVLVNALAVGTESEAAIPKTTTVIASPVLTTSTLHIKIKRAGVDGPGGYITIGKR